MTEQQILQNIAQKMKELPGHLGFYYKNLTTGYEFGVNEEESFSAASVIKLPLYLHILSRWAEGSLDLSEKLLVREEDKVPICGALTLFSEEVEVDIRTLCNLMISISDNTATNRLVDYCGVEEISKSFRKMGLEKTVLRRKLFDFALSAQGIRNEICPKEIGILLEKLYRKEFVNEAVCKEAMDLLQLQQVEHKLNGRICGAVPIAHKTGEDDNLSNDVGIVLGKQPFVICFAGHDTEVYPWEDLMRNAAWELWQANEQ